MSAIKFLFIHRQLLWSTTLNEIRGKYAGTLFGLLWTVIYPILFLGMYTVVYTMIFKVRVGDFTTFNYVLLIFSGLIPFLGFAEALGTGVGSVVENKNLIKNTLFPIELIPVKAVLSGSVTMLVGLVMLQSILWGRGTIYWSQLLVPFILILQILFSIGIIWLLSALNVFIRDLSQTIGVLILFLMLVSPIAYTIDMIPPQLMPLVYPNPLFYLIMLYRESMVQGHIPVILLMVFTILSVGIFLFGYFVFSRLKTVFSDYV
jgi:lipopolysaccharide transport system permease protein